MIITCPACDAQYLLPDESIAQKGRRVKCTSCDYTWLQMPEIVLAADEVPEDIDYSKEPSFSDILSNASTAANDEPMRAPRTMNTPIIREKSAMGPVVAAGLGMAAVLVFVTLGVAIGMRHTLVRQTPSSAVLFDKIGFPVNIPAKNMVISDVSAKVIQQNDGKEVLQVTGNLTNNTEEDIDFPRLIVRMNGKNGWLKDWTDNLYGKALVAGKTIPFDYKLHKVPTGGQNVTVLFVD